MNWLKSIAAFLVSHFSKLQLISIAVIVLYAFFISESNIFTRMSYDSEIRSLKKQINHYKEKAADDSRKLKELDADKDQIEKFARENYLMKKPDEDIFIVE